MPAAPRKHVSRGDISEMMGWSRTDLRNFRDFLCQPTQLRIWSTYLSRKDPNSNEKGLERKHLLRRAVDAIRNDEEKFTGLGTGLLTKDDNQLWVVVQLIQENRMKGCVWEGKGDTDLETMCKTATEIMKMLSLEFSGQRSATSATVRRMKDIARIKRIDLDGGRMEDVSGHVANFGKKAKSSGNTGRTSIQKGRRGSETDGVRRGAGRYEEVDMVNATEFEGYNASYETEDYEQYTPADGINMFMLGLIVGLVALVLVLLLPRRREFVLEKTQWTLR